MKILKKLGPLSNIEFNKLFLGEIFSHFADGTVQFILISILLSTLPKAGTAMAILLFAFMFPQFILSPFAGAFVDKVSRKMVLSLSSIFRGLLVVAIILLSIKQPMGANLTYVFSFLLGTGATFFYTAKMSVVPNIVESSELKFANAINSAIGSIALLFGAFFANFLIEKMGEGNALWTIVVMYALAGCILATLKFKVAQKFEVIKKNILEDIKISALYLKSHKKALSLVLLSIAISFIASVFSNSLNSLITDYYGLEFSDLSTLRTMLGIGIVVGMGVTIYLARFIRIVHLFALGFITLCFTLITAPLCQSINSAWIWLLPIGIADAIVIVMGDTILQKVTPDRLRGKIFGFELTLSTLSFLVGTLVAANLADDVNPLTIFKVVAIVSFLLATFILLTDKSFRYFLLKATVGQIFLTLFKYKFEGLENLPKTGKIILAGNHTGHLDVFIIQMATKRHLWFVTGPEAYKIPVLRHFLPLYNTLPLQFGKGLEALDSGIQKLKKGEPVVIFPEGKFTPDGNLCNFHRGVSILAKEADSAILPFAIHGGFEAWGRKTKWPKLFTELTIQFGQPIYVNKEDDEKAIAKELQNRVNFMKNSLDRRVFYKIDKKLHNNFLDLMQEKGDIFGERKALSLKTKDGYVDYNYIEISRMAKSFANYLIEEIKIEKNDRIAILTEARPEFSIALFASIQTGAITVPLDCKLTINEWCSILSDCNPTVLCCSSHYLEQAIEIKEKVESIKHIFIIDKDKPENCEIKTIEEAKGDINKDLGKPRSLDETALIVYTSGTTGNPKGVMISFANIYSQLRDFETIMKIDSTHSFLSILPLNHLLELNVGLFGMMYMGAKVCYVKSLNPKEITNVMKDLKITNMIVVPLFLKMLKTSVEKEINKQNATAKKLFNFMFKIAKFMPRKTRRLIFKKVLDNFGGALDSFIAGGAPLDVEVGNFFERLGIAVYQGYGLTETSPVITFNSPKYNKMGSVGKPIPSVCVKLAENGEILTTGANVMQGYYNKPQMTSEVIDENGWFHTGDIGEFDKQGYLHITGRIKNMIVLGGGKKIFPEEVEAVLEKSPLIKELCVLSLKIKSGNKAGTEEVGVIIVPSDELAKKSDEEIQKELEVEVKTLGEESLAQYKIPTVVVLHREELPKTSTRKVKRNVLVSWYEGIEPKV